MGTLPIHPMLVHLPIALAVLMPLVAGAAVWAWWQDRLPRPGWWAVVVLQAVLVLSGMAALRTGEADEERVEEVVPERALERHEEAAQVFVAGAAVVLALTIAAGLLRDEAHARGAAAASVVAATLVLGLGYRVGEAGGELVYRFDAPAAFASAAGGSGVAAAGAEAAEAAEDEGEEEEEEEDD